MTTTQIKFWNEFQVNCLRYGLVIIEYMDLAEEEKIWKCYLEAGNKYRNEGGQNRFEGNDFNQDLSDEFQDRSSYSNTYWNGLSSEFRWRGFFVPVENFAQFSARQFLNELNHNHLLSLHFDTIDYLKAVKTDSIDKHYSNIPIPLLGLWHYARFYHLFLKFCLENDDIREKPSTEWHSRNINFKSFHKHLPSHQLFILFMNCIESYYATGGRLKLPGQLLQKAHSSVQDFFEKLFLDLDDGSEFELEEIFTEEVKSDFIETCTMDTFILSAMYILHIPDKMKQFHSLHDRLWQKAYPPKSNTIFANLRRAIRQWSLHNIIPEKATMTHYWEKYYFPKQIATIFDKKKDWSRIEDEFWKDFKSDYKEFPEEVRDLVRQSCIKEWQIQMANLANRFTPPIFTWQAFDEKYLPQWNIPRDFQANKYKKAYFKKQESLDNQRKRLQKQIRQLEKLKSLGAIKKLLLETKPFFDPGINEQWEFHKDRHSRVVAASEGFRRRKMIELGFENIDDQADFRNDIWLEEMLTIEDQIKKYIPYVKKAFKAALPIRKTVEFDSARHHKSGVEFDPNTINDQNKWLRGDVMKTLKSKTTYGEIEQINAFCLDFSGSMRHERMRNLFKILYLLVLGLEDRKSYDAFHFFNSEFIEGVDFDENFTSRSLLFSILSKISTISNGEVLYGGMLATNISGAVSECHDRIKHFKDSIAAKKPHSKFLCSLIVITDGRPNVGITNLGELNDFIEDKRQDGDVAIKGIYIKDKEDENSFMQAIFGEDQFVETIEFDEAVNKFTSIITKTYKEQRQLYKWKKKQQAIKGINKQ